DHLEGLCRRVRRSRPRGPHASTSRRRRWKSLGNDHLLPHPDAIGHAEAKTSPTLLNSKTTIRLRYVVFDVLEIEGESTIWPPYREPRAPLDSLARDGPHWQTSPVSSH